MDYNFDPSEMDLDTDDQRWWREYYCLMCQPARAGAFHMGVSSNNGGSMGVASNKRPRYKSKTTKQKHIQRAIQYQHK